MIRSTCVKMAGWLGLGWRPLLTALFAAALIAGCGGSGSGSGSGTGSDTGPGPASPAPPPPAVQVDEARKASATVTPAAGGTVEATGADGTVYTLTVPPGALSRETTVTITPLLAADGVKIDKLVAGVRAEPSGLRFAVPPTLTLRLPTGAEPPPYGWRGFLAADDGTALEFVPQRSEAGLVTMAVPHFSVVGVAQFDGWLYACREGTVRSVEHHNACVQLRPLFDAERARVAAQGGALDVAFVLDVMGVLQTWGESGLLQRMRDAQQSPYTESLNTDDFRDAKEEWYDWMTVWEVAGEALTDRRNEFEGRLLGALIDRIQEEFRLLLIERMNKLNLACLSDRGRVGHYVWEVTLLPPLWSIQGPIPLWPVPWDTVYCVDIRIEAFVPPVLTPGQNANLPVDIRVRFSDGVELPGQKLSVVVTATDATVTPGGGFLTTPVAENFNLAPSGTTSRVTITAAFANDFTRAPGPDGKLEVTSVDTGIPRTARFGAGEDAAGPVRLATGYLRAEMENTGDVPRVRTSTSAKFPLTDTVSLDLPSTIFETTSGDRYRAEGSAAFTRTVRQDPGGVVVVATTGRVTLAIESLAGVPNHSISARVQEGWCFNAESAVEVTAQWDALPNEDLVGRPETVGGMGRPSFYRWVGGDLVETVVPPASGEPFRLETTGYWCTGMRGVYRLYMRTDQAPVVDFNATVTLRPA